MPVPVRRPDNQSRTPQRYQPRTPQRWEPFHELEQLQEQMDQFLQTVWSPHATETDGVWIPVADIEETDDAWIVEAELPGVDRKDVNVELRDSELVISGEIKEKEREGVLRRRTRRTGSFEYRVMLPGHVNREKVEAKLNEGVLTVRVPKAEQASRRRIDVKSS